MLSVAALVYDADVGSISLGIIVTARFLLLRWCWQYFLGNNCYCSLSVAALVFDADVHSISLGIIVTARFLLLRWCLMLMLAVFPWD